MVDYKEVLDDLRQRKVMLKRKFEEEMRELDAAVAAIEKMVPPAQGTIFKIAFPPKSDEPKVDAYRGLTLREAARRCLEAHGSPMSTKELSQALLDGGFETAAKTFTTTVYGTLARYDEFHVDGGIWSLADWKLVKDSNAPHGIRKAMD